MDQKKKERMDSDFLREILFRPPFYLNSMYFFLQKKENIEVIFFAPEWFLASDDRNRFTLLPDYGEASYVNTANSPLLGEASNVNTANSRCFTSGQFVYLR